VTFFCYVSLTSSFTNFLVSDPPRAPIWSPFGYQIADLSNQCGKVATAFSLERGHQNQAFQGLYFTTIHHFLIRVVETCDRHPSSKALFTLSWIYGPTWHPFETQICNILHFIFLLTFSPNIFLANEISGRHLRHIGGKGGTTAGFPPPT
jgi:hypothetical protein